MVTVLVGAQLHEQCYVPQLSSCLLKVVPQTPQVILAELCIDSWIPGDKFMVYNSMNVNMLACYSGLDALPSGCDSVGLFY